MGRQLRQTALVLVLALAAALAGCNGETASVNPSPPPSAPAPVVLVPATPFLTVTDPITGFSTTDLYADDRIVQITRDNELVLTSLNHHVDRVPGFSLEYVGSNPSGYIIAGNACPETRVPGLRHGCSLEVVFGSQAGQPRAYLTPDYGHDDNPGTVVGLFLLDGAILQAFPTLKYPPGTSTLSGVVTAMTESGPIPVEGAEVRRRVVSGWRQDTTDEDGFYYMGGLINNTTEVSVSLGWTGCETQTRQLTINGDTRLDVQLACQ